MEINLNNDIYALSNVPVCVLNKLADVAMSTICNSIQEAIKSGDNMLDINTPFGILTILLDGNNVAYKFVPNKQFTQAVTNSILEPNNQLETKLQQTLLNKIFKTYKEFV